MGKNLLVKMRNKIEDNKKLLEAESKRLDRQMERFRTGKAVISLELVQSLSVVTYAVSDLFEKIEEHDKALHTINQQFAKDLDRTNIDVKKLRLEVERLKFRGE